MEKVILKIKGREYFIKQWSKSLFEKEDITGIHQLYIEGLKVKKGNYQR